MHTSQFSCETGYQEQNIQQAYLDFIIDLSEGNGADNCMEQQFSA